ncbi:MAG: uracil-DNA glycosylase [Armatimonadetes bacterium]|nr:uracil-DNA glycosylase [Armatimonadota bacterium]
MLASDEPMSVEAAIEDVRRAAMGCLGCKLHALRTQVVFGVGNPRSPLVLVGQSPGEQEDQTGLPFVGPAGQLLGECLGKVGIRREQVWITNIVKCRPFERTSSARGKNRDPEPDEVEACQAWIEAELALLRPKVIVCIGAPSAQLILGRRVSVTKDRGRFYTDHRFRPAQVLAVLHPAYILRHHGEELEALRQQLVDDLESARRTTARLLKEPAPTPPAPPAPEPEAEAAPREQMSLFGDD